ncbi:hypothetical protein AVEN_48221-1 [Araneus ventricosus]|uniref:Uncharacterized protein n=1 Tax=Araneus ventricosus TaxID=182803 RepID=A0A4Y2SYS4_ARAVE|nr:hypothetical protein AVEN_48221-1 [Araneus ventricosus]
MPGPIQLAELKNRCKSSSGKSGATSDIAPSDYIFLPKFKEHLSGTRFSSESDAKTAAENCLHGHGRDFYPDGLKRLSCVQINASVDVEIMWKSDR